MREECQKSIKMRSLAIDEKYSDLNIREEQDKVYKKYLFYHKDNVSKLDTFTNGYLICS